MAAAEWFYGKENKQHGPVSAVQLKELAQRGTLKPTDLVWREGMDEWTAASKVKGLFDDAPAEPKPPPPPAAPPKPGPPGDVGGVFAGAPDETPILQGDASHVLDAVLEWVRRRFPERFIGATSRLFTLSGHYGLYAAMGLVLGFGLIAGVKMNDLNVVLGALGCAIGLAVLQYGDSRFFKSLDVLNRSTSGTLASAAVPDCFALLSMVFGALALLGMAVTAVQNGWFLLLLPAIVTFILCQYVGVLAVNRDALNIDIDPSAPAGEEALGILSFALKVGLRLVPVAFGAGVACGALMLLFASVLLFVAGGVENGVAEATSGDAAPALFNEMGVDAPEAEEVVALLSAFGAAGWGTLLVVGSAALPLVAYLVFVFMHLAIDVIRAVLAVPGKLDVLGQVEKEEGE